MGMGISYRISINGAFAGCGCNIIIAELLPDLANN